MNRSDVAVDTGVAMRGCPCSNFTKLSVWCCGTVNWDAHEKCSTVSNGGSARTGQFSSFIIYSASKQEIVIEIYAIASSRHTRPFVLFSL